VVYRRWWVVLWACSLVERSVGSRGGTSSAARRVWPLVGAPPTNGASPARRRTVS